MIDVSSLSVGISDVSYVSSSVDENGVESNSVAELGSIELESALSLTNSSNGDDSLLDVDVSSLSVGISDVSYVSSSVDENGVESNSVAELGSIELESALSLTNSSNGDDSLLDVDVSSLSVGVSDVSYVSSSVDENGVESNSVAELGSIELESVLSLTNSSTGDDSLLDVDVSSLSVGISDVSYVSSSVDENGIESNSVAELGGIELESALSLTNSSTGDDSLLNVDVSSLSVGISDVSYVSSSVDENGVESNSVAELGSIELESALSLTNSSNGNDSLLDVDVSSLSVGISDVSYVSSSVDENGVESNSVAELGSIELESALSLTNSSNGNDSLLNVDVSSLSVGISDVSYASSSVDENGVESNSVAELGGIELESALSLTNSSTGDDSLLNVDVSSLSVGISDVSYVSSSVDENGVESNSVAELGSIELESALGLTNSSTGDDSLLDVDVSSLSVGMSDVSYVSSSIDENGVESNSVAELGSIELESALSLTNSSTGDDSLLSVDVSSLFVGISDVSYVSSSVDENGVESSSVAELGGIELESALSLTNSSTGDDSLLNVDVSSLSVGISDVSYVSSSVDENGVESNSVAELGNIELESALSLTNSSTGDDSLLDVDVSSLSVGISDVSYVSSSVDENGIEDGLGADIENIGFQFSGKVESLSSEENTNIEVAAKNFQLDIGKISDVQMGDSTFGGGDLSFITAGVEGAHLELEGELAYSSDVLGNEKRISGSIDDFGFNVDVGLELNLKNSFVEESQLLAGVGVNGSVAGDFELILTDEATELETSLKNMDVGIDLSIAHFREEVSGAEVQLFGEGGVGFHLEAGEVAYSSVGDDSASLQTSFEKVGLDFELGVAYTEVDNAGVETQMIGGLNADLESSLAFDYVSSPEESGFGLSIDSVEAAANLEFIHMEKDIIGNAKNMSVSASSEMISDFSLDISSLDESRLVTDLSYFEAKNELEIAYWTENHLGDIKKRAGSSLNSHVKSSGDNLEDLLENKEVELYIDTYLENER